MSNISQILSDFLYNCGGNSDYSFIVSVFSEVKRIVGVVPVSDPVKSVAYIRGKPDYGLTNILRKSLYPYNEVHTNAEINITRYKRNGKYYVALRDNKGRFCGGGKWSYSRDLSFYRDRYYKVSGGFYEVYVRAEYPKK